MTSGASSPRARRLRRLLAALAVPLVALVLLRTFVARSYRVTTGSMEPTILGAEGDDFGGESVLVTFGVGDLQRYDLVVVDREGSAPFVKRIGGLPGESVRVLDGDLLIGGQRLGPNARRPAPIELFDSDRDLVTEHFHFRQVPEGFWRLQSQGILLLMGGGVPPGSEAGMLLLHKDLRDGYRRHDGSLNPGSHTVGDGGLEVEFRLHDPATILRARLVEEGDLFELTLGPSEVDEPGVAAVARELVLRRDPGGEVLVRAPVNLDPDDGWHRLSFENRDNHLSVRVLDAAGEPVIEVTATYDTNRPYNGVLPEDRSSVAPRVAIGGAGGTLRLRRLRVFRDLHYLPIGTHAVDRALDLGPDEYFLLGDNSADSADGRLWGPVPAKSLIGRPRAVVSPTDRWRVLR